MLSVCNQNGASDVATNLRWIEQQAATAAAQGSTLLLLPENCSLMPRDEATRNAHAEPFGSGPVQAALAQIAADHRLWLVVGSLPLRFDGQAHASQTQLVFDDLGRRRAHYRKIHLFDVKLDNGETYCESDYTVAGDQLVLCDSPLGSLGLSICYDLRFPAQYQALRQAGAQVLLVPAAFTEHTGRAHWHTLLRARAIENQCYVAASAQCGQHASGRSTFGHALVYDPWGELLLDLGTELCTRSVALDGEKLTALRARFNAFEPHKEYGNVSDSNG